VESDKIIGTILNYLDELKNEVRNTRTPWFTITGACSYTGFGSTKIRKAIREDRLKAFRQDGSDYRIHQMDLDCYLMYGRNLLKPTEKDQLMRRNRYYKIENLKEILK
jgi:excisionase family DNA binding protein